MSKLYRQHSRLLQRIFKWGKYDVNEKVTINNVITILNDGDEDYNEEKERTIVHEEEEYKKCQCQQDR